MIFVTAAESPNRPTLIKLGDTDRNIADPDEDVRGRVVIDVNGEELGKVADLLVDDSASQVRFLLVEHGGILGIGATETFIPVDAITEITPDSVWVDRDMRTVAGAPQYDPEIGTETEFYQDVYGYYGVAPFWTPGYMPPPFPRNGRRG
jgi:sporulation protein YlmC with PRC-barrel domain